MPEDPTAGFAAGSSKAAASPALFQRRKRLRDNGLIVMEKAAPKRHRRQQDRQDGDHTHYRPPTQTPHAYKRATTKPHSGRELVTDLQQSDDF